MPTKLNVVIVGGGAAGCIVAGGLSTKLDKDKYNLILIDKRPLRIWMLATARLGVSSPGTLEQDSMRPYDRVFSKGHGEYVQGEVAAIEKEGATGGHVVLASGKKIPFHALVLSPGSIWDGPFEWPNEHEEIQQHLKTIRQQIKDAQSIVIAGGGAVGLEIAGEIKDVYSEKSVTIVQGGDQLLNPAYPDKFRQSVLNSVKARGIQVVFNEFVDEMPKAGATSVKTRNGKTITADLVIRARGPKPNTSFIVSSLGSDVVNESGYVKVKKTLQLVSHPDIFAAGDIVDIKEQKQAAKAGAHGGLLIGNVFAYLEGTTLKDYKGSIEGIFVTNGKDGGVGYLPFLWGLVLGNFWVRTIKARGLLLGMYSKSMGY